MAENAREGLAEPGSASKAGPDSPRDRRGSSLDSRPISAAQASAAEVKAVSGPDPSRPRRPKGTTTSAPRAVGPRWRWREALLLLVAGSLTFAAHVEWLLGSGRGLSRPSLLPPLVYLSAVLVIHAWLSLSRRRADQVILPAVVVLQGLGLALAYRLAAGGAANGPDFAARQLAWSLMGLVGAWAVLARSRTTLVLRRYQYSAALVGALLVGLAMLLGRPSAPGGPRLWIALGGFGFQPSEVQKLALIIFLAGYLDARRELVTAGDRRLGALRLPPLPYLAPLAAILGLSLGLLAAQGDLGAALLLYAIALGMLFAASGRLGYVVLGLAAFVAGAAALTRFTPIIATRLAVWRDPFATATTSGYQLIQGLEAMASGGILGTGLGLGSPSLVPAVHTDFVFAGLVEELGLMVGLGVLALYGVLVLAGLRIAISAATRFEALLAAGISFGMALQTFIIIGGVTRLVPLTGITLPFLSYGGTSMVISSVGAGLLLAISEPPP